MTIQTSDIVMVLSGGTTNTDPTKALGSDPSSYLIATGLNNLFDDVSENDAQAGKTDFRCFYIFNDNGEDTFSAVKLWIDSQTSGGCDMTLGFIFANDTQIITVVGLPSGGSFTMEKDGHQAVAHFDPSLANWGLNVQTAINTFPGITGAVVSASQFGNITTFQVSFQGNDANRFQSQISISANNLTGGTFQITATKLVNGSPINSVATEIDMATTVPPGVLFVTSSAHTPINIGNLKPSDGFPVWVKRVTSPGIGPVAGDTFTLKVAGDPIQ